MKFIIFFPCKKTYYVKEQVILQHFSENCAFFGLNRKLNLSKVGTRTGTVKKRYGSSTLPL
jgi:hypothetical protein